MITVIIKGTKNIHQTLRSLEANARDKFRVLVDETIREGLAEIYKIEFVKPRLFNKYGKKSHLYWELPSGCLILCSSWDVRLQRGIRNRMGRYCLLPGSQEKFPATNSPANIGKWEGPKYIVPILRVTEV